ncbi:MAG: CRISPR-associated helicase Cas3' [Oscillospiraceae bacterium]|nr:CRISPR-associated helicase Cas3' [Oscillospiraceae bacterium]
MLYYAHKKEDGQLQTVRDHGEGTASLCARFAGAFGGEADGYFIGMAHDLGKCSEGFQRRLLEGGPIVDHATAGAIACAMRGRGDLACAVIGHHGGMMDLGNGRTDAPGDATCFGRMKKGMANGLQTNCPALPLPEVSKTMPFPEDPLAASFWTRMLYSCLVDGDYQDTERFMTGGAVQRGGFDSLEILLARLRDYIAPWQHPVGSLNTCRSEILNACLHGGQHPQGLYTLTVPTGGGKTISSLAFALSHGVAHQMERVIYVVPYTSIIEQNAAVFRKILGAENVIEHHSGVTWDSDGETSLAQCRQRWAVENWDAPVIVTTAVQFFESLYSNKPSKCRKLHNLSNSVVIFDEAQMIPTAHLRPCVAAIANLVAHFRTTAVLCTATQPVLGDLFHDFAPDLPIRELCPKIAHLFAPFRRVTFRTVGTMTTKALADALCRQTQVLCIVNSRKGAQDVFSHLPTEGSFHLSTLLYPAHRQAVLDEIRCRLKAGQICRVVSTSLIEAGVDVDFPAVYREQAGLDSILQAAGRCNREGKRPLESSVVTIFESELPLPPLFQQQVGAFRESATHDADISAPETIQRYFSALRSLLGDNTDDAGIVQAFQHGIAGCDMPFATVAKEFHLIDNDTKTIYLPFGEGEKIVERLRTGQATKKDYRKAGRYSVSVYEQHFVKLEAAGALWLLDEDSAILQDTSLYDEKTGLSLEAEAGQALCI